MRIIVLLLPVSLMFALVADAGTPPDPYQDSSQVIVKTLGGVGRTQGWSIAPSSTAATDMLADASIPAAIKSDVENNATLIRTVTLKKTYDDGTVTALATCARMGPSTDAPALTCPLASAASPSVNGGCYLVNVGDSCQFAVRPISSCASYADCHTPIWLLAATGGGTHTNVSVSVAW